jgi:hypothetical protein
MPMLLYRFFCLTLQYTCVHRRGPSPVVMDAAIETVRDHVDGSTAKCHSGSDRRQYLIKRLRVKTHQAMFPSFFG